MVRRASALCHGHVSSFTGIGMCRCWFAVGALGLRSTVVSWGATHSLCDGQIGSLSLYCLHSLLMEERIRLWDLIWYTVEDSFKGKVMSWPWPGSHVNHQLLNKRPSGEHTQRHRQEHWSYTEVNGTLQNSYITMCDIALGRFGHCLSACVSLITHLSWGLCVRLFGV